MNTPASYDERLFSNVNPVSPSRTLIIFHHDDPDGACSAYHVERAMLGYVDKVEWRSINYGQVPDLSNITVGTRVAIVDYSFKVTEMDALRETGAKIIWIDHHGTAIKAYDNYPYDIDGWRVTGYSGCYLAFLYFTYFCNKETFETLAAADLQVECAPVPDITYMVHLWDTWKHNGHKDRQKIVNFIYGVNSYDFETYDFWDRLHFPGEVGAHTERNEMSLWALIEKGKVIFEFKVAFLRSLVNSYGVAMTDWFGHSVIAVNFPKGSSLEFSAIFEASGVREYDIYMPFYHDGTQWTFSLYTTDPDLDVSDIAAQLGGGGHPGAAGFQAKSLPWEECSPGTVIFRP